MKNSFLRGSTPNFTYSFLLFVLFFTASCSDDKAKAKEETKTEITKPSKTPEPLKYNVTKMDTSGNQLTFHLFIEERAEDENRLVEIARSLREQSEWNGKLVCFFQLKSRPGSDAWASCSYLPKCPECVTHKDMDGNPVQFRLIGMPKILADSLWALKLDTIPGKEFIGAYLDDSWRCKTEIYKVQGKPGKLLMARLYTDGHIVEWLTHKHIKNNDRFYYDDTIEGEKPYFIIYDYEKGGEIYHFAEEDKIRDVDTYVR